jgi:radical SAM superfamily enzyme YgiQ (UPF0313 family)
LHRLGLEGKRLYFVDLDFTLNNDFVKEFLGEVVSKKLEMPFWTATDTFIEEGSLDLMKKAGCFFFYSGVESGSKRLIDSFYKLRTRRHLLDFFTRVKRIGISTVASLVLMYPQETRQDMKETLRLCKELIRLPMGPSTAGINMISYPNIFRPYPNTDIALELEKKGWQPPKTFIDWGYFYNEIANGDFKRSNFTKDISKGFLFLILIRYVVLNFRVFFLPRLFRMLREVIAGKKRS